LEECTSVLTHAGALVHVAQSLELLLELLDQLLLQVAQLVEAAKEVEVELLPLEVETSFESDSM